MSEGSSQSAWLIRASFTLNASKTLASEKFSLVRDRMSGLLIRRAEAKAGLGQIFCARGC